MAGFNPGMIGGLAILGRSAGNLFSRVRRRVPKVQVFTYSWSGFTPFSRDHMGMIRLSWKVCV